MRFIFLAVLIISGAVQADERWIELRKDEKGYTIYGDAKSVTYGSLWTKTVYKQKRINADNKYFDVMTTNFQFDCAGRTGGPVKYFQYLNGQVLDAEGLETPNKFFDKIQPETGTEQLYEIACKVQ